MAARPTLRPDRRNDRATRRAGAKRLLGPATGCLVFAIGAAGCASSPGGRAADPASQLLTASSSAFAQQPVVHISGSIVEKGKATSDSITVDATSGAVRGASEGTLDLEGPGLGFEGKTSYIVVGGITYVNAGTQFWQSLFGAQTAANKRFEREVLPEVTNLWVELDAKSTETVYKDTFGLSDPKVFVGGTVEGMKGSLHNAGAKTLNGVSGVEITSSAGGRLLVASSAAVLPVELAAEPSGAQGLEVSLKITYPASASIAAPAHPVSFASVLGEVSGGAGTSGSGSGGSGSGGSGSAG